MQAAIGVQESNEGIGNRDDYQIGIGSSEGKQNQIQGLTEKRGRANTGVDGDNILQMKKNTSQIIDNQIQRIISTNQKFQENSSSQKEDTQVQHNSYGSDEYEEKPNANNQKEERKSDKGGEESDNSDEFEDAFDNEKDLLYFNKKMEMGEEELKKSSSLIDNRNDFMSMRDRDLGLRRTASFSNIIQEEVEEENTEDVYGKSDPKEESKRTISKFGSNHKNSNEKAFNGFLRGGNKNSSNL